MLNIENSGDYESSPYILKDAFKILASIFVEDDAFIQKITDSVYRVIYPKNKFTFEFFNVNYDKFSLNVIYNVDNILTKDYLISDFENDMYDKLNNGFESEYGDIIKFECDNISSYNYDSDNSLLDDSDEEISEKSDGVVTKDFKTAVCESIVPDNIEKIRVVALRFNGNIIAFRFKTDKGAFDMRIEVATKYGLGGFKTEKFINLERVNGILMSSTEKKLRTCVPDVSLCEEDCKKLIDAIFNA